MEDDKIHDEVSPAKYLKMSREGWENRTDDCDDTSPSQTPKEWLEKLTALDFADPVSVIGHRHALTSDRVPEFILCTGEDILTVSPRPTAMSVDKAPVLDHESLHEGLLTLEFVDGSEVQPVLADGKAPESSLPSVVLPIGQLRFEYKTSSGIPCKDDTDYVLVVDAITPGHPVWLIWDRLASHKEDRHYIPPDELDPVFKGVKKNFDAAQILPSINDWFESYGNLDFNQLEESIKATGLTGFVKAKKATLACVTELLGQAQSQVVTDIMEEDEMSEEDEVSEEDEMSDARFAEIRAALGTPFQGKNFCPVSPYEYIRKVEEATAHDNSLDQYLRKASKFDINPLQSGLEWLQKLAITDFANVADICAHRRLMDFAKVDRLNLVANDKDNFYFRTWPRELRYEEIDGEAHKALLSLETSALGGAKSLPKLILPVGVLVNNKLGWCETGYVVVIDAVAPGHPVWLIYDRDQDDELGEERLIVDPADARLVFEGIGHNFDAAQIFLSVQDWIKSYGNVDFAQLEESIKATCITGALQAKEILLSEAQELLRQ